MFWCKVCRCCDHLSMALYLAVVSVCAPSSSSSWFTWRTQVEQADQANVPGSPWSCLRNGQANGPRNMITVCVHMNDCQKVGCSECRRWDACMHDFMLSAAAYAGGAPGRCARRFARRG